MQVEVWGVGAPVSFASAQGRGVTVPVDATLGYKVKMCKSKPEVFVLPGAQPPHKEKNKAFPDLSLHRVLYRSFRLSSRCKQLLQPFLGPL